MGGFTHTHNLYILYAILWNETFQTNTNLWKVALFDIEILMKTQVNPGGGASLDDHACFIENKDLK